MVQYIELEDGCFQLGFVTIANDEGNRHYAQMWKEVDAGTAEIVEYAKPIANLEVEVRAERDHRLVKEIDIYTGIRWASCTTYQKGLLNNLRNMLLNIPDQEGFPADVEWPAKVKI